MPQFLERETTITTISSRKADSQTGFSYACEEVVTQIASRIQGITVEIGGDTTKLSKALESVNKSIKGTQSELKDVNKLLKLDPSNEKPERYPCGLPLELHE